MAGKRINARRGTPGTPIWHRDYWDVIVWNERALSNIRNYIRCNPQNYEAVMQVGEPRFLGNQALWSKPKAGFLASRSGTVNHGSLPLKSGEVVISGFLSPMERAVFKACLECRRPTIWVRPWGLADNENLPAVEQAIREGCLLVVSPFADGIAAPSIRRAAWCNQYVLAHCDRMLVGHLQPDGMLACILAEAKPGQEIIRL